MGNGVMASIYNYRVHILVSEFDISRLFKPRITDKPRMAKGYP